LSRPYPISFAEIGNWAAEARIPHVEARIRYAQYVVLRALAASPALRDILVLKGGNALDFVWFPNRSTRDLDFSADLPDSGSVLTDQTLQRQLTAALRSVSAQLGGVFTVQTVRQNPRGADKRFVTHAVTVGYALSDEFALILRMKEGRPSPNVIPLDVSLNEEICATTYILLDDVHRIRISAKEDIVAEKLRALLQQPIRNRHRCQDLRDLATLQDVPVDRGLVAAYLQRKSIAPGIAVTRTAFHHSEVAARAQRDYDALRETARNVFVPYDEALRRLYALVDDLPIPD